jgi:outer membrane PBP1 activator LpoA protein
MIPPHDSRKKEFIMNHTSQCIAVVLATLLLSACGVETVTTAATVAKLQAKQAEEAQQQKAQIMQQLDQAQQQAEAQRQAMDAAAK